MNTGNTALGYQMMIEGHYIAAMMNCAQRDLYHPASLWAENWAALMGYKNPPSIQIPTYIKDVKEYNDKWMEYFFKKTLNMSIFVGQKLEMIRQKYSDKKDIPQVGSAIPTTPGGKPGNV